MKKRIRKKMAKRRESFFGHVATLRRYHCEKCDTDFDLVGNKNLHIEESLSLRCPICKEELKELNLEEEARH
jgi:hypothetical protein